MRLTYQISVSILAIVIASFLCSASLNSELSSINEGTYFLKMGHSGRYISVKNAGKANGSILWQWDFHGKTQQQFEFKKASSGYYYIKAMHSGKYVSVKNAGKDNGAILWQWDFHGKAQQQFALENAGGGYYYIKAKHSGRYLSIKNAGKANGAILWQWDFHGKGQQKFKLEKVSNTTNIAKVEYRRAVPGNAIGCGDNTIFDLIDGGTCWTCPSGYNRTVFAVNSDKACERPSGELFAKAKKHGRGGGLLGTDCDGGQFLDPDGYCYSCPNGYNRTAYPVTSDKACSQRVRADYQRARKVGKAQNCGSGYFFDIGTNKCWSCPEGFKRTVFAVDSDKACEKIQIGN